MTKKTIFLLLLLPMVFGAANLYAQVTIGSDDAPHSGAILDLQSDNKGLKLPSVSLLDTAVFQLSTIPSDIAIAKGMMVYNTNDNTKGGRGQGIYTWNGTWIYSGGAPRADIPVSRIAITSEENVNTVKAGETLKLTAHVLPDNASNKKLAWSVSSSLTAGKAVVNDTGLVTAIKSGDVTVRASAIDGSNVYREFGLTVRPVAPPSNIEVYSETGEYSLEAGLSLQLLATIEPENTIQNVKWEVRDEDGVVATVNTDGLVTGLQEGFAQITAKVFWGEDSLVTNRQITVTKPSLPANMVRIQNGDSLYLTYAFGNRIWMVENSWEGTATYTRYDYELTGTKYYTYTQALNACKAPWALPSPDDVISLINYVNVFATTAELKIWSTAPPTGYFEAGSLQSGGTGRLWKTDSKTYFYYNTSKLIVLSTSTAQENTPMPVRCVMPKVE
jgi:uncharacterized protein YjdB